MLSSIRLQNFRSYVDDSFEFSPGVNIIVGPNASGKTNLLESVLVVANGSSYRAKDAELTRFGAPWTRLDAQTDTDSRTVKVEHIHTITKKTFEVGEQTYQRLSLQRSIPTVLFEPNHLSLLTGSPDGRRNFLDDLIEQTVPGFGTTRRAYRRVLAQRNSLLKKGSHIATQQIFVWNLRLSELGGKIAQQRMALVAAINHEATEIYQGLSKTDAAVLFTYQTACSTEQYETDLLRRLEVGLEKDCLVGFTTTGPHRDDLHAVLNDRAVEESASRGETRTLVLTLKTIELQLLENARDTKPLLLLDDVFSELDGARRQALTAYLQKYQTFITTTDADVVVKHFTTTSNIIPLSR